MANEILEYAKRVKAISDIGLLYCENDYERERHTELRDLSLRIIQSLTKTPIGQLASSLPISPDYPTAKIDIRGLLFRGEQMVLVKERDGKWSLPGGWADVGFSPAEIIAKEFKEETGLDVVPKKLLAVFDKRKHPHPIHSNYVYKMVFYCEEVSNRDIIKAFDVLDVGHFHPINLPPLSEDRILKSQIERCVYLLETNSDTYFD
jgi:ADP-ribose pyrophosphatase YjhB (NUDIX family)